MLLTLLSTGSIALEALKVLPPERGIYLSGHPYSGPYDDILMEDELDRFISMTGRGIVWMYLSWNWDGRSKFPSEQCKALWERGIVPMVGVMPWSERVQNRPERRMTLGRILAGVYDAQIAEAANSVRSLGFPVMITFGPEADGGWFPWSGRFNGGSVTDRYGDPRVPDGPERFKDAFRRFVKIFEAQGAFNVTWVFHLAERPGPDAPWNRGIFYYPGDDVVDWMGVSLYGRLGTRPLRDMSGLLAYALRRLRDVSRSKPLAVLEWSVADGPDINKPRWMEEAFRAFMAAREQGLRAVAWWDKGFKPDGSPSGLDLGSSPPSLEVYRRWARLDDFVTVPRFGPSVEIPVQMGQ
ncbi:beta-mannanase [Thermanaerovibrio velox DSM 12556]|uniref:Beta-mannanase n=1 Tax=Thermanaerovibrio velox DSM 12556 TaxID=926567 RepID=H0USN3_9BACT|nr:glycosyl hydrolase [Thermanaerovibrio velox]EHM10322.1 beta-mannanase [Thermanaerovibrio velox DSM 12556]